MSQVPYLREDSSVPTFTSVEPDNYAGRIVRALAASALVHAAGLILLIVAAPHLPQTGATTSLLTVRSKALELIAPPKPLTQKEPNRAELSKEFTVESIQRQDAPSRLPSPGAAPKPALSGRQFRVPGSPVPAPTTVLPEAPNIDVTRTQPAQLPPTGLGTPAPVAAPPQIQTEEKPKLAFERPGTMTGAANQRGVVPVPKPASTLDEAIRQSARGGGGVVVGDADEGFSTPAPGLKPAPSGGKMGSSLELLSDPQGADFRPYLTRLLSSVRRNWFAVVPESARLGRQGRVVVRFSVTREGTVQNLQITMQSGTEALDRAAVAGISASHPFPPLPPEFRGGWVRLQLTFLYNVPR